MERQCDRAASRLTSPGGNWRRWLRWAVRCSALVAAVVLAWPWQPGAATSVVLPALSPYVALGGVLAARTVSVLLLLAAPVLVLVMFFPRWFCRHACPTGLLQKWLEKLRPRSALWRRWPRLGRWLALATLGGAALGYPVFLWLDPLGIFNGFLNAWSRPITGLLLPVVLLLTLVMPKLWCQRLCPLGGFQELVFLRSAAKPASGRRAFLVAGAGAVAALAVRTVRGQSPPPLRPPGALDETEFIGACIRCGNCIQACPSRIIQPDLGRRGLVSLLTPVLSFEEEYCHEDCHRCTTVCPSGAIARLTLDEKSRRVLGSAKVDMETCELVNGEGCSACIGNCPYTAIAVEQDPNDLSLRPGVDVTKCVGCGACELACPVVPRAIRVVPGRGVLQSLTERRTAIPERTRP